MSVDVSMKLSPKQAGKLYMKALDLEERLKCIKELLDHAWDSDAVDYTCTQAVNQAHRVAAGGPLPRKTNLDEVDNVEF